MTATAPIGVFDSGYGGLTILDKIKTLMPGYDYIYLGDNARAPYGTRSFDVVYRYTLQAVEHLFDRGCNLVILACNTASAKALRTIQQNDLPQIDPTRRVLGVIRPTVEQLGEISVNGEIGVLATPGTIASESYDMEIAKLYPHFKTHGQACPMWVPIIENNLFDTEGADYFISTDIENLQRKAPDIDTVILGCTHYPLIADKIRKRLKPGTRLVEQGLIVARSLQDYLERHPEMERRCSRNSTISYLTTENPERFNRNASLFLKERIDSKQITLS